MENQLLITLSRNKLLKNAEISKIDIRSIRGRLITIGEGEILYREGDLADIIYLVTSGEINILKKRLLGKTKSYLFGENDFFGHEEFFEETARTSTAVALRDSYLIALTRDEVETLISQDDEILINLREPVAEIDEEFLSQNHSASSEEIKPVAIPNEEIHWAPILEDKPSPSEPRSSGTREFTFDEKEFLNEDGIPKAEFELPDLSSTSPKFEEKNSDGDLNDALFNILSRNETSTFELPKKFDEPVISENDEAFFESFGLTEEPAKLVAPPIPETPHIIEENVFEPEPFIPAAPKEEIVPTIIPEAEMNFEQKEIRPVAEEKIEEFEKIEVPEKEIIKSPAETKETNPGLQFEEAMNRDELQMIIKAAGLVNSNIRVDEVLKNIVDVATDLTHSDRGTLYLVDKEKNELWSLITLGDEMREIRLRIGEGLAGFVAKSGETVNIKDVSKDPRFKSDFDRQSGYTTKNMICFPIKNSKSEIIGVLQLLNSTNGEFTKRDEEFLAALSIHSAIALNNAELVEKLLQVERVQSLGKMANFLIQDIKKPILVSKRYAEHLRSKPLPPDTLQILDMLLEQLTQVADLVQTTSSYSEGKTILRALNVSLNNTLADYASRVEQYVESRKCQILADYDKDVTVKLDVKEFFQSYMHIIKNACDAMPDGGKIYISTKRADKWESSKSPSDIHSGKVEIRVKDNGLGIPDGIKDKIFEPFMTHGKKEGTGLGLAITKKIIEVHNGAIEVQSSLGEGATFIITLPVASTF